VQAENGPASHHRYWDALPPRHCSDQPCYEGPEEEDARHRREPRATAKAAATVGPGRYPRFPGQEQDQGETAGAVQPEEPPAVWFPGQEASQTTCQLERQQEQDGDVDRSRALATRRTTDVPGAPYSGATKPRNSPSEYSC
jgi:hypothetical protein